MGTYSGAGKIPLICSGSGKIPMIFPEPEQIRGIFDLRADFRSP
jgi:hypothetical protein